MFFILLLLLPDIASFTILYNMFCRLRSLHTYYLYPNLSRHAIFAIGRLAITENDAKSVDGYTQVLIQVGLGSSSWHF